MGTFLKYVFYIALIVVIYLIGKGIFDGQINEKTTIGGVVNTVEDGVERIAKESADKVDEEIQDYQKHPKKQIELD